MIFIYNFFIHLYFLLIKSASFFNAKAAAWIEGRERLFDDLERQVKGSKKIIWVHCSSAGEFEQGKPVIEALKSNYPSHRILVSFFSPSGFKVAGNYKHCDWICYIPLDTRSNAKRFLNLVNPELVIFIKYEFWYHLLSQAAARKIPVLLVSAVFRKDQLFFKAIGKSYKKFLYLFKTIIVQDKASLELLHRHNITHAFTGGDTRFDRVAELAKTEIDLPFIDLFRSNKKLLVAGSTWPGDEKLLQQWLTENPGWKLLIAPHEIDPDHIESIKKLFPGCMLYSILSKSEKAAISMKGIWANVSREETDALKKMLVNANVLVIDNVGMLSRLYYYADASYVGGGFTKDGIHNVLEPAAFGKPVFFGTNYKKYREAGELIAAGGGFSVADAQEMQEFFREENHLIAAGNAATSYVIDNKGAVNKVMHYIQENRLLTS